MAAKLKKRALAEYQSQVEQPEQDKPKPNKKLKLLIPPQRTDSTSSSTTSRRLSTATSSCFGDISPALESLIQQLVILTPSILQVSLSTNEVNELIKKVTNFLRKSDVEEGQIRSQLFLSLANIVLSYPDAKIDLNDEWLEVGQEVDDKSKASMLCLLEEWMKSGRYLQESLYPSILKMLKAQLCNGNHQVKIGALKVLGAGTHILSSKDRSLATTIMIIINRHTTNHDPRVRKAAFGALLSVHNHGLKLDSGTYQDLCKALNDDYEGVRMIGLKLVQVMALSYPEEQVPDESGAVQRLIDDAFGKICYAVQDLSVQVRELSVKLIGTLDKVSPSFIEQTLDKKLMSNMRVKKSAHERQAQIVASGQWSSGKNWADDAPREELDADSVNLMAMGACGAFIHGLEDEFLAVRSASIDSLTALSIKHPKMAASALDFLVDMFNDEIEGVRLKAIEALTAIADHISLQAHQLETILWALDDFSIIVREKLHEMLQASSISTKDGLQNVVNKLLENLKRYPQDRRSILLTCKKLGSTHAELVLPLVTQLLEIHPFFDTAEPDIEDPAYLCILVLVFNAANHCPTLGPLLDEHTKRHYHFLEDTYPHLLPSKKSKKTDNNNDDINDANTTKFAKQIMHNVETSTKMKNEARIKVLTRSCLDLDRLSSIEPTLKDAAIFASLFLKSQILMLKCLSGRFWNNGAHILMQCQQSSILSGHINELFKLCLQLEFKFTHLKPNYVRRLKLMKLKIRALHLVFLMKATNKSALNSTEIFLKELEILQQNENQDQVLQDSPFLKDLIQSLAEDQSQRKAGNLVKILQPLLSKHPIKSLPFDESIRMSHATIYEPSGNNETPLKYTAGMILAVPVDCELFNVKNHHQVRIAILTPDQKIMLVSPKSTDFIIKSDGTKRLLTNALVSHQVWSEALHVEMQIVLDVKASTSSSSQRNNFDNLITLSDPIKVYVLPKAAKRGI